MTPPQSYAYGVSGAQHGELHLPDRDDPLGTVVVIHGGFWRSAYGLELGRPLAADLAGLGYVAWNLEYRRVGGGGGWPGTFDDVAAGIDHLAVLAERYPIDLGRVVAVGHSAGGQLAVWAAARAGLPDGAPGARPVVRLAGAVSQAGVLDLRRAADRGTGGTAVQDFLGADSGADRYALASPIERVPIGVPVRCVHAVEDANVPMEQSERYVAAASAAGDDATVVRLPGDHFVHVDPSSPAWRTVVEALPGLVGS